MQWKEAEEGCRRVVGAPRGQASPYIRRRRPAISQPFPHMHCGHIAPLTLADPFIAADDSRMPRNGAETGREGLNGKAATVKANQSVG